MVDDSPSTVQGDLAAAAEVLAQGGGVSWAYELLEQVAARNQLSDAWLHVGPVVGTSAVPGAGPQLFRLGGRAIPVDTARALLQRPAGVYGEPPVVDAAESTALGAMCGAAFRASIASLRSAVDPTSGLQSRFVIGEAIGRAVACGARYGWSSTLVVLTTAGEAPPEDRWLALATALGQALRTGDEAGVTAAGIALALLGNAGPDAVRPFIARVRAALSAGGWDDVDLHAATARTPEETVDPGELRRLAAERLADAGVVTAALPDPTATTELELRLLPGVVSIEMATPVVVVSSSAPESLDDDVLRAVRAVLPHASVQVLTISDGLSEPRYPTLASDAVGAHLERPDGNRIDRPEEAGAPYVISATAPSDRPARSRGGGEVRVSLLSSGFDAGRGTSEVSLGLGAARGTGRASSGPLAGGAQATLNALEALGMDVPFYLMSVERAHGVPGDPVVVVLAPKRKDRKDEEDVGRAAERLGVASGDGDVEAASRATLGALNRHLARSAVAS